MKTNEDWTETEKRNEMKWLLVVSIRERWVRVWVQRIAWVRDQLGRCVCCWCALPRSRLLASFCSNTYWCVSGWFYSVWNSNNKGIKTVHSCTGGAVQQQAKVKARQRRRTHTQQIEQMEQQQLNNNIMAEVMKLERTSKSTKQTNTRARFRSTRSLLTSAYQTITYQNVSKISMVYYNAPICCASFIKLLIKIIFY